MTGRTAHRQVVGLIERRRTRATLAAGGRGAEASALKLGAHGKLGVWVWIVLLGADATYELVAFFDGSGGAPTLSQLVKRARRAGGLAGSIILALLLAVGYVVLNLHWVVEAF